MAEFTVTINTDNAAFENAEGTDYDPAWEIARILTKLADGLRANGGGFVEAEDDDPGYPLIDYNGNKVGRAKLS